MKRTKSQTDNALAQWAKGRTFGAFGMIQANLRIIQDDERLSSYEKLVLRNYSEALEEIEAALRERSGCPKK